MKAMVITGFGGPEVFAQTEVVEEGSGSWRQRELEVQLQGDSDPL